MATQKSLIKYKIGLLVLGIFSVILLLLVLPQAAATKQDNDTYTKATNIADKLNTYVDIQQTIPASLASLAINNVPTTVSYHKLSDSSYRFCVTYKTKSIDFSPSSTESQLLSAAAGSAISGSSFSSFSSDNSALYLDSNHKKGPNCQTVNAQGLVNANRNSSQPQGNLTPSAGSGSPDISPDPYAACNNITHNQAWTQCVDNINQSQNSGSSSLSN